MNLDLKPIEFITPKGYSLKFRKQRSGEELWGIYDNRGNNVWNKKYNDFEWEPMPSSRDDDFIKNTRFSFEEAKQIVEWIEENYVG